MSTSAKKNLSIKKEVKNTGGSSLVSDHQENKSDAVCELFL
jgi:hypothetical protein